MTRNIRLAFTIAFFSFILSGCSTRRNEESDVDIKPKATVKVVSAARGNMDDLVTATGSFEVLRDEKIKSSIAGKVEEVFVLEGDRVQKGDLVVTIVSEESYAAIAGATRLLDQAVTQVERKQAEEALRLAKNTSVSSRVSAPFSGSVIHRFVTEGELVSQGADLVEIIDPSTEYFLASVPVNSISSVNIGQAAIVTIPGMDVPLLRGVVQAINQATDLNSQSVDVRISLHPVPANVAAGTFGNVHVKVGEHKSVVVVPKQAVYHDDELGQFFIWRIQGDSIALMTKVEVGLSDSTRFEITSGIKVGDVVATVGGYGLPDSTDVTIAAN